MAFVFSLFDLEAGNSGVPLDLFLRVPAFNDFVNIVRRNFPPAMLQRMKAYVENSFLQTGRRYLEAWQQRGLVNNFDNAELSATPWYSGTLAGLHRAIGTAALEGREPDIILQEIPPPSVL